MNDKKKKRRKDDNFILFLHFCNGKAIIISERSNKIYSYCRDIITYYTSYILTSHSNRWYSTVKY